MIHLDPKLGEPLRELAVLTTRTSAPPHLRLEPCVHERGLSGSLRLFQRQPGLMGLSAECLSLANGAGMIIAV